MARAASIIVAVDSAPVEGLGSVDASDQRLEVERQARAVAGPGVGRVGERVRVHLQRLCEQGGPRQARIRDRQTLEAHRDRVAHRDQGAAWLPRSGHLDRDPEAGVFGQQRLRRVGVAHHEVRRVGGRVSPCWLLTSGRFLRRLLADSTAAACRVAGPLDPQEWSRYLPDRAYIDTCAA
jgi:hypothetical protein